MRIVILLSINFYYQSAVAEDRNLVYKEVVCYHNKSAQKGIPIPAGQIESSESWVLNVISSEIGEEVLKLFSIFPLPSYRYLETKAID